MILIAMPSYAGMIPATTVQSLLQLHKPFPCAFMIIERQRIDKARNACVVEALKSGADYLMFLDDDNPVPPETLEVLLQDDKDIVSAPILGRMPKDGKHLLCAFYSQTVDVDGKPLRLYSNIEALRGDGPLHQVDAVGTGCVLIKRKVLERLFAEHRGYVFEFGDIRFGQTITVNGASYDRRTMSEDCEFCERAVDAGFEIWLDTRVRPYHMTGNTWVQYG